MRELMLQTNVARGVNSRIAGLQKIVHPHADGCVAVNTGGFEIEPLDVWQSTGAGKNGIDRNRALVVVTDEIDQLLASFHAYPDGLGIEPDLDTVACEGIRQDLCGVAFFLG